MKKIKCVFFVISLTLTGTMATAQVTDSVKTKTGFFSKVNLSKIQMPKLHLPKVNLFKKDTTVKKDTVIATQTKKEKATLVEKQIEVKPQDTAAKKSFFSKLNFSKLNVFKKDTTKSNVIAEAPIVVEKKVEVAEKPVVIADVEKVVKVNVPAVPLCTPEPPLKFCVAITCSLPVSLCVPIISALMPVPFLMRKL